MNNFIGCGRLTKDVEMRYAQGSNMAIARFTVAIDRRGKKGDEQAADFISCVAFDKRAEFIEKYFHQGNKILFTGHIQTGSYTNKDGKKVYTTDVVVDDVEFCESKGTDKKQTGRTAPENGDGFMDIPEGVEDDGLPFN